MACFGHFGLTVGYKNFSEVIFQNFVDMHCLLPFYFLY